MRSHYLAVGALGALGLLTARSASADDGDGVAPAREPARLGELGAFAGGFIASADHQFYQQSRFPMVGQRPELHELSPEYGLRYGYFFTHNLGLEAEGSVILANTRGMDGAGTGADQPAKIYSARLQGVFQVPLGPVTPYFAIGGGPMHTSSAYLGSDTDVPIHAGVGLRFFISDTFAIRADARYLRGPSDEAPYTLNTGYFEFGIGISLALHPGGGHASAPPPVDGDRDGDGIPDSKDKCPDEPEDKDMFQDADGCPDPDNDGDGIPDILDKCPLDPEDKDGFQDADGCPDLDNDGDGIPDKMDKCPNEPEDKDGFQDLDGCPDPDNDNDGIPDIKDKCPNEPETINGFQDEDGCPDRGDPLVVLSPDRLELLDAIQFRGDKLQKASNNLLGQIGAQLRAHQEIVRLRITVHVQPTRDADRDQTVSDHRAAAIRDWLVNWGIAAKRLEARGFGGTKPLVPATQKGAAATNERIELIILERK